MPIYHIFGNILFTFFFFFLSYWLVKTKRLEKVRKRNLILLGISFLFGFVGFYFSIRPDIFISFFPFAD